jgi:hypothetical protein
MIIDLEKLNVDFFVDVERDKDRNLSKLVISPRLGSEVIRDFGNEIAGYLGFNEMETEALFGEIHRINVLSAIRKCSRW